MTNTNPNPNDVFWLARYAHNTLTPVLKDLPGQDDKVYAYLYLAIVERPKFGGLDIWVHADGLDLSGVLDYATINVTKETVDSIAKRLPVKWQEALAAAGVTA